MVSSTDRPWAAFAAITAQKARRASTSSPTVGSSRNIRSGIAAEGEGEEHPLLLAARELAEQSVLDAVEAGRRHHLAPGEGARVVAGDEIDVLADLQGLRHLGDLEHGAGAQPRLGAAGLDAEQPRLSSAGRSEAEQELDRGGLAGAVGAEQGDDLAGPHREIDPGERRHGAVPLDRPPQLRDRPVVTQEWASNHGNPPFSLPGPFWTARPEDPREDRQDFEVTDVTWGQQWERQAEYSVLHSVDAAGVGIEAAIQSCTASEVGGAELRAGDRLGRLRAADQGTEDEDQGETEQLLHGARLL